MLPWLYILHFYHLTTHLVHKTYGYYTNGRIGSHFLNQLSTISPYSYNMHTLTHTHTTKNDLVQRPMAVIYRPTTALSQ